MYSISFHYKSELNNRGGIDFFGDLQFITFPSFVMGLVMGTSIRTLNCVVLRYGEPVLDSCLRMLKVSLTTGFVWLCWDQPIIFGSMKCSRESCGLDIRKNQYDIVLSPVQR